MAYRVVNSLIKKRCGFELSTIKRMERKMVKWFGRVKRMGGVRKGERVFWVVMKSNRGRGRPQKKWIDEVRTPSPS